MAVAMSAFWTTLAIVVVIVWAITLVDLFRRRLDRKHTLAWVLIVVLLPIAGSVLYWVLRRRETAAGEAAR